MIKFGLDEIQQVYREKGYVMFNEHPFDLNIFGIRSRESKSDKFDDWIGVWFKGGGKENVFKLFSATTDPGKHWLLTPMRKEGTAIMVPGQYRGLYKYGYHKNYRALEQCSEAEYVRDNNKDAKLDFDLYRDPIKRRAFSFRDNIKSNLHKAGSNSLFVGAWSAACQVLQKSSDFDLLMKYVQMQINSGLGDKFTYSLLEEFDFKF